MDPKALEASRVAMTRGSSAPRPRPALRRLTGLLTVALALSAAERAAAQVSQSGDVSPPFAPAPVVDLTGQSVFIGNTQSGVGSVGTVTVIGGGILTAAQLVPGTGGLGTGFVNVSGPGSTVNLTGGGVANGLDIASWGTGVVTVSNGGTIACATIAACAIVGIGNGAGSTGTLSINGGSVTGAGRVFVGQGSFTPGFFGTLGANTSATLSITNGGTLTSWGSSLVAGNFGQTGQVTGNVTINGAGSSWTIGRDLAGGGTQAGVSLAPSNNAVATMTLSNGGNLTINGGRSNPATDNTLPFISLANTAGATATMTVTSGSTVVFSGDTGFINVGGNNGSSTGGTATLNITGGGKISGTGNNGLAFVGIGRTNATGTVNISGPGSQLLVAGVGGQNTQGLDGVGGLVLVGTNGNGVSGTLNISNGGLLKISDNGLFASTGGMGLRIGDRQGTVTGTVTVSGAGSSIVVESTAATPMTPYVIVGNGATGIMTISDGAAVSVLGNGQRNFTVGNTATGSGLLNMSNGATIVASRFAVGDNGGTGTATIDNSTINLNGVVFNNGLDDGPLGANVRVGRGVGANGLLTLQNGAVINIDNTIENSSVILGGTNVLPGGTGTLNMSGNSRINFVGSAASAALQVGGTAGTGFMTMAGGSSVNVGATGSANVGGNAGTSGTLAVGTGSTITANVFNIGGNSDTTAGGTGSATVSGIGSALNASGATGFLGVGRNGTGALTVDQGAAISGLAVSIGRGTSGFGTLTVDGATVNLAGQQTTGNLAGANLSIGLGGGTGAASIANGSVVTISNPVGVASLNIGGTGNFPGGSGSLALTNSQINLTAAAGQALARVGHDGTGVAAMTGSTLNVGNPTASGADGSLLIAGQAGSAGIMTLNGGSVVNAGYVGVGATTAGPGGAATMMLNNSTVNTTTFEIGQGGLLGGNNGVINASGDVIVAGVISPGNSPGRITINCNLIMLPGSLLMLEVVESDGNFSFDQLRIGSDSTFDLSQARIEFHFVGGADPEDFVEAGGLDLDNFIQSIDQQTGQVTGLSSVFAPGQTWEDVVGDDIVAFSGDGISKVEISADGSGTLQPVPEPSTWALLAFGLFAVASMSRRRSFARAR